MVYLKHNTQQHFLRKTKMNSKIKRFDVKAIDPTTGRPTTFRSVSRDQLRQNDSGETVFRYNDHYDSCEVISVVEIPQEKLDAERRYFEKYGTANE